MDIAKTAQLQQTILQINLMVSTITHTKVSNEERGLLNAAAKRLEREFINEVLGLPVAPEKLADVGSDGFAADVSSDAPVTKREPRKLTKK